MKKPIDQAAIRVAAFSSNFELPNWLGVEKWVYFTERNCHVLVKGWLGNLVEIDLEGKLHRVQIDRLSKPRFGASGNDFNKASEQIDLSAINHPTYKAIATAFIDDLNAIKVLPSRNAILTSLPDSIY
jgi:hypothetical protein